MKSHIDWNELFPRFKKELKDTLLLEAVTLLSTSRQRNGHDKPEEAVVVKRGRRRLKRGQKSYAQRLRHWGKDGNGGKLSKAGRRYKIVRDSPMAPKRSSSKIGKIWAVLTSTTRIRWGMNPSSTWPNRWSLSRTPRWRTCGPTTAWKSSRSDFR